MAWTWNKSRVGPDDILDAVNTLTLRPHFSLHELDLLEGWTTPQTYLQWAQDCLRRNDDAGRDSAVCYAKRAVCRQIDGLLITNHLGKFAGRNYPEKLEILTAIGMDDSGVVHELVIDPRNEIEHGYQRPTQDEARKAVQIANLYLKATAEDASHNAIIAMNWCLGSRYEGGVKDGVEFERIDFDLLPDHDPMLLIDCEKPKEHTAIILIPRKSELTYCAMEDFALDQAKQLTRQLRSQITTPGSGVSIFQSRFYEKLKADLSL